MICGHFQHAQLTVQGGKRWECNLVAVWTQMATGGGTATISVLYATMWYMLLCWW